MKKMLFIAISIALIGSFAITNQAQAIGMNSLPYVFSPNSDSTPYTPPTTDDVFVNQWDSVWLAKPYNSADTFVYPADTTQAVGIYGVAAPLATLGTWLNYTIKFDYHLKTYDSSEYDNFKVAITSGNNIWSGGTSVGGWSWGGSTEGGLEVLDSGLITVPVAGTTGPYYLNVVLQTTFDNAHVSWGRFSDVSITGNNVPLPPALWLLGSGLIGLAAVRRKFRK